MEVLGFQPPFAGLEVGAAVGDAAGIFMRHRIEFPPQVPGHTGVLNDATDTSYNEDQQAQVDCDIHHNRHAGLPRLKSQPSRTSSYLVLAGSRSRYSVA